MALRAFADGIMFGEVVGGRSPRVLALHGWGRRAADFNEVLAGLDAISLDLPGFGASPPPEKPIGAMGYAELVADVLELFEVPPVVVGHSFGGRVALCLADIRPDEVARLILTGAPLVRLRSASRPSLAYRVVRALNRLGFVSDERLESERRRRGSADYRATSGVMREVLVKVVNESYETLLERIQVPVDLLWGAKDSEVPLIVAQKAANLIKASGGQVTLTVVETAGHHTPLEAPQDLRAMIDMALGE